MRRARSILTTLLPAILLAGPVALAEPVAAPELGALLDRFNASAPEIAGSARLDAWVESDGEDRAVVIVVQPEGETKLIADPGITISPVDIPGVRWLLPMPHREVDPSTDYFAPPASIRLPYQATGDTTVEIRVEYAYCVIDVQCFFGEETLEVAIAAS